MAIFSTHLLNSINGSHARNVKIIIYKINGMDRTIFLEAFTDEGGRMHKEFSLSKDDCDGDFEMIIKTGNYFNNNDNNIISEISMKFKMKDPQKKYHMPLMISPNSYSVWWSN